MGVLRRTLAGCAAAIVVALAFSPAAAARMLYVTHIAGNALVPIDTATNTPGTPIPTGSQPMGVALTPDGGTAYVANRGSNNVTVIDTEAGTVVKTIPVGQEPSGVAVSPDGKTVYVGNHADGTITPIDTQTNTAGPAFPADAPPMSRSISLAVSPDGKTIYAAGFTSGGVTPFDAKTHAMGSLIPVSAGLTGIAITPDGKTAYVVDEHMGGNTVTPVDLTEHAAGTPIAVGQGPRSLAITRDGHAVYVTNGNSNSVSVIDTSTNHVTHTIAVGSGPSGIAITPDDKTAYVHNAGDGTVTPIDLATKQPGSPIHLGAGSGVYSLQSVAVTPIQAPVPKLSAPATAEVGELITFDASATTSEVPIKSYRYDFGDGATAVATGPTRRYAYSEPGTYQATVTTDDGQGCVPLFPGLASPFTGQTAYCNGPSQVTSAPITVEVREATQQPPPPYLKLSVSAERRQPLARRLRIRVRCANFGCAVTARGRLEVDGRSARTRRFRLAPEGRSLEVGGAATLSPAIPAAARRAARRALGSRGRAWAVIRVVARGEGAQRREALRRVRVVR